jgi:hypothetical protein
MSELEEKYRAAQKADEATGKRIRAAIAVFLKRHPELHCCEANEKTLFRAMEEADYLNPETVSSWEILYAENRNKLIDEAPAARKQTPRRPTPAATGLTRAEVDSWSSKELQRQMESSQRRAEEINAVLAHR